MAGKETWLQRCHNLQSNIPAFYLRALELVLFGAVYPDVIIFPASLFYQHRKSQHSDIMESSSILKHEISQNG